MKRHALSVAAVLMALTGIALAESLPDLTMPTQRDDLPGAREQGGSQQELVIPPAVAPRAELPADQVLIIPQASRDFVGRWGGRLKLQDVVGRDVRAPGHSIVTLAFGESDGTVFVRTTVFAPPGSNVLKTDAAALTPRQIQLNIDGFDIDETPPVRHVERLNLVLDAGSNVMKCSKQVELYLRGSPTPFSQIIYEGELGQLSERDEADLAREVFETGNVPQATIDERRPAYGPQ